ncbi:related to protein kinase 1 [Phialocephala subalpina]|uniref:Related to protein kinase 1 n=1 Tax=Phialocephala subalpina TaxID=576137 RepID=A0A1L7XL78_9HELO|nr:related to protein kinase 1 [Phialocephala subalpina]
MSSTPSDQSPLALNNEDFWPKKKLPWELPRKKRANNPEDGNINKFLSARTSAMNAGVGISLTSASDDNAQKQIQDRSGVLTVFLHEAVGLSLPEHYKQLLNERNDQLRSEPGPNVVATSDVSLESSISHDSWHEMSGHKRHPVYALFDVDKSQVLVPASSGTVQNPLWTCFSPRFDVTHSMELSVHLYLRNEFSTSNSGRIQDICLGIARFSPTFENGHDGVVDPDITQLTIAELGHKSKVSHQKWLELECGTGQIHLSVNYSEKKTHLQIQDFDTLKPLGNRYPRTTFQVYKKYSGGLYYALKRIEKTGIGLQCGVEDAFETAKHSVLSQIKSPFIVPIKFAFQSPECLYLVSPFVHGGELWKLLHKQQRFDVDTIRLYTAEILCALECLHDLGIICGDLKPQNILLDYSGHVSVCDFGLCKLDAKDCLKEPYEWEALPYLAPEIRFGQACTEVVDWWTLGILLAEMLSGLPPSWYDEDINGKIEAFYFPDPDVVAPVAQDISIKLFNRNPKERLGAKGIAKIKTHPFFDNIDWCKVLQRGCEPIFKPNNAHILSDSEAQENAPLSSVEELQRISDKARERYYDRAILSYRAQLRSSKS